MWVSDGSHRSEFRDVSTPCEHHRRDAKRCSELLCLFKKLFSGSSSTETEAVGMYDLEVRFGKGSPKRA